MAEVSWPNRQDGNRSTHVHDTTLNDADPKSITKWDSGVFSESVEQNGDIDKQ
jgi:hypothetical protein